MAQSTLPEVVHPRDVTPVAETVRPDEVTPVSFRPLPDAQISAASTSPPGLWERIKNVLNIPPGGIIGDKLSPTTINSDVRGEVGPQFQEFLTATEKSASPTLTNVYRFSSGMVSPGNMLVLLGTGGLGELEVGGTAVGKLLPRLVSAGFGAQMLKGITDSWPRIQQAYKDNDGEALNYYVTNSALSAVMATLAGRHAAGVEPLATLPEWTKLGKFESGERAAAKFGGIPTSAGPGVLETPAAITSRLRENLKEVNRGLPEIIHPDEVTPYEGPQAERTSSGKLKLGAETERLGRILGSSLYEGRGPGIVVKELMQNAFDAIRPMGGSGKVTVHIDDKSGEIHVTDNGIGMTPDQVYTVFSNLGSSGKGLDPTASGGFGLAKAAPFIIADKLSVVTTAVDPSTGKNVTTSFTSTPDDILSGNVDVEISPVPLEQTGTIIKATVPKDNISDAAVFATRALNSVNAPGQLDVTRTHAWASEPSPVDPKLKPLDERVGDFPHGFGNVTLHRSRERTGERAPYSIDVEVHNNGIYQFRQPYYMNDADKDLFNMPHRIAVDIKSGVPEGHADYPFAANRERLSKSASDAVNRLVMDKIIAPERDVSRAFLREKYNSMPVISTHAGDIPIFDSGARMSIDEFREFGADPAVQEVAAEVVSSARSTIDLILEQLNSHLKGGGGAHPLIAGYGASVKLTGEGIERIGLVLSDDVHGVYVPNPADTKKGTIFINPFSFNNIEGATTSKVAGQVFETIRHEILHDIVRGHNEAFTSGLNYIERELGADAFIDILPRLMEVYGGTGRNQPIRADLDSALSFYKQTRSKPTTERDILGGESLAAESQQPPSPAEDATAAELPEGGGQPVPGDIPPPGGSGNAEERGIRGGLGGGLRSVERINELLSAARGRLGESGPPTLTPADLGSSGITIMRPHGDLGIIARHLGSLSQVLRHLPEDSPVRGLMGRAASTIIDTSLGVLRDTKTRLKDFRGLNVQKAADWDKLVTLLDNPDVTRDTLPGDTPANLRLAYNWVRDTTEHYRVAIRDIERAKLESRGMSPEDAANRVPDNWGIKEGYYHHAFPGNWTVQYVSGYNDAGVPQYSPVDNGWRQSSLSDATATAKAYLAAHPGTELTVKLDTITLPSDNYTERMRLRKLTDDIRTASELLVNGENPEGVMKALKGKAGAAAYGPRRVAGKSTSALLARDANLPGWARDVGNFESYLNAMERYIKLAPIREEVMGIRNDIAKLSDMGEIQRIKEMPKAYSGAYARALGKLDASIEALEGYPTAYEAAVRRFFDSHGWDPSIPDRASAVIGQAETLLKLGYNFGSVVANMAQPLITTYPVLGEKWTLYGYTHAYSPKYADLVDHLGIKASSGLLEPSLMREYSGAYFGGEGIKAKAAGAYDLVNDIGMFAFNKAEETNRRVSAIGAYEKGISEGMSPSEATRYAQDVTIRTQFLTAAADMPSAIRALPRPMAQFKTFTVKMLEYMTGLRGSEIPRFLIAMGIIGYAGLPALSSLAGAIETMTGYNPDDEFRKTFPTFSRGLPGALGIDLTRTAGFSDWLGPQSLGASRLAGPAGSDIYALIQIASAHFQQPSREAQDARTLALRSISPTLRRGFEEGARLASGGGNLMDPVTGNLVKPLSPKERIESVLGVTPLGVSQERDLHARIQRSIAKYHDQRGYFVDRIAEQVLRMQQHPEESDAAVATITSLTKEAVDYNVAGNDLSLAVRNKVAAMMVERLQRDLKTAPGPLRPEIYDETQPGETPGLSPPQ